MRLLFLILIGFFASPAAITAQKKQLEKADEYYKLGEYANAIPLYESALDEKDNLSVKTKLAYCYRMNNRIQDSESLYADIVKDEKARSITYFYYAEALMSNEKYDEAKMWFEKYAGLEPEDPNGPLMAKSCDLVKTIQPFFHEIKIVEFDQNTDADENSPVFWDGGVVFSSDRNIGVQLLKQKSGWTGRDFMRLYYSRQNEAGDFEKADQFSGRLNELNKNTGNASFAYDSSEVFFTRNSNILNKKSSYNLQLFRAEKSDNEKWKDVEQLPFGTLESNYMHPAAAPDKNTLYFVSDKPGGEGGTDIYKVTRKNSKWSRPENLGPNVNTSANEGFPFIDKDGRLFFCSKGWTGYGGFDIFMAEQDEKGDWKKPVNLGKPVNSPLDDISIFIEKAGTRGLFTSNRKGGDDDIYIFYLPDAAGEFPPLAFKESKITRPQNIASEKEISAETVKDTPATEAPAPVEKTSPDAIIAEEKPEVQQPENQNDVIENSRAIDHSQLQNMFEETAAKIPEKLPPPTSEKTSDETPVLPSEPVSKPPVAVPEIKENTPQSGEKNSAPPPQEETKTEQMHPAKDSAEAGRLFTSAKPRIAKTNIEKPGMASFKTFAGTGRLKLEQTFILENIKYGIEEYVVADAVAKELDKLVVLMQQYPDLKIEISGHTEKIGDDKNNQTLSRYRAEAAAAYLLKKGIAQDRVTSRGYGETQPLNNCQNEFDCNWEEHLVNQRLEVKIEDY